MESKDRWVTSRTSVYNLGYHIIWCPKYRRSILTGEVEERLKALISEKSKYLGCTIEKMEVMPDYVHIFIKTPPTIAVHFLVTQLKGYTSRILRSEFRHLRSKLPCLWTRSYYAESVGYISEETIIKYIQEQKNK